MVGGEIGLGILGGFLHETVARILIFVVYL